MTLPERPETRYGIVQSVKVDTSFTNSRFPETVGCVHVCDMKNDGERIFSKEVDFSFPTHVPRSAYDQSLVSFKREYLSRLSEDIGFMFYERYHGDKMGWAN